MASDSTREEGEAALTDRHLRIGRALLAAGSVTHAEIFEAIRAAGGAGPLEEGLLQAGFASEEDLITAALASYRIPRIRLEDYPLSPDVLRLLPGEVAVRTRALPIGRLGKILVVATPHIDAHGAAAVRAAWQGKVILVLASPEEVEESLRSHYPGAYAWARAVPAIRAGDLEPQTLVPAVGREGDLPAWWRTVVVGEGPAMPAEELDED